MQDKQINPPELTDLLKELKQEVFKELNCVNIGRIESFDGTEHTATVKLMIDRVKEVKPNGEKVIQPRPLCLRCPAFMLFGGSAYMTFPISQGDECIVLFNDRQIDTWFLTGEQNPPQTGRTHDLSDAIALVGLRSLGNSIASYLETGIRIDSGTAKIDITDDQIDSTAAEFIHTGNMQVTGNDTITGNMSAGGTITSTGVMTAGNGATGTFTTVTVLNGIVTGGS